MRRPPPLFQGARVALLSASSAVPPERLGAAEAAVRALGLEPVLYPSCYEQNRHGYLAGSDIGRADDLNRAFSDKSIDGIWCIRGGYGAHRILPLLDWTAIGENPKWFGGYSDVTALHTALNQVCDLMTWHIVMPSTEYDGMQEGYTRDCLNRALFGGLAGPVENPPGAALTALVPGRASAPLCGGNLSLLAASLGTPWALDARGKILFLEDIGEKTYRVDAMLTQLRNAAIFQDCAGVLLGAWTDCVPEDPARTLTLGEIFRDLIVPAGKPVLSGLSCGHTIPSCALPLGAAAVLDADRCTLEVL